jgi:glycosyltransferase involved in cell wall biosynthesis
VNILLVNWLDLDNPQAGGAEQHLFEIFARLVARGHRVHLVTSGFAGAASTATIRGLTVERHGGRQSFALAGRGAVKAALARERFDIVVEDINKLPLYLPTLTRLPVYVIIPHLFGGTAFREASLPVASLVWLAERPIPRVYRRAAWHAISESTRDDLVARGVSRDRIRVIYPGVDADRFRPDPACGRAEPPMFLYVGRLKRYKGVATALDALARVRAGGTPARLVIAGQGDDRPRLEKKAAELRLDAAVEFAGFVSEDHKRHLLQTATATVFPSAKEGWGIANVEAAACGTPALAADRPGLRESVRHGETGYLVPHGDASALADRMTALARAPALVARLGWAARAFAETLSWDAAADQTAAHLEDTLRE